MTARNVTQIKVLVVDDSAFMRKVITEALESDDTIKVIGVARNGRAALEKVKIVRPDVVTLDYMMPGKDGLETLSELIRRHHQPVVMVSSYTARGADITMKALSMGAVDFVLKPSGRDQKVGDEFRDELIEKVHVAAVSRPSIASPEVAGPLAAGGQAGQTGEFGRVVVIGCSTGGPQALQCVVPRLNAETRASYLIVQHMPPKFTKSLAERLDSLSHIKVREAAAGDRLQPGRALLAPGDYHMTVGPDGVVGLNQTPSVGGLRPRADVTMEAAANSFRGDVLGVVLTGMGNDGARGMQAIKAKGGKTIAQDEESSVIFGMPKAVIANGSADEVLPLDEIAAGIMRISGK